MTPLSNLAASAAAAVEHTLDLILQVRAGAPVTLALRVSRAASMSKMIALTTALHRRPLVGGAERMRLVTIEHLMLRYVPFSEGALVPAEIECLRQALVLAARFFAVEVEEVVTVTVVEREEVGDGPNG